MQCEEKDKDEGGGYIDNQPLDAFEQVCVQVDAPGPSLNHVADGPATTESTRLKTQGRDCQWWIVEVVHVLTREGVLEAAPQQEEGPVWTPLQRLEAVPKH